MKRRKENEENGKVIEKIKKVIENFELDGYLDEKIKKQLQNDVILYGKFIEFYKNISNINFHQYIIGQSFAYAWMPTMLKLNIDMKRKDKLLFLINKIKKGEVKTYIEIMQIMEISGVSIVGNSKLFHFINPNEYAIYDSKTAASVGLSIKYNIDTDSYNYIIYNKAIKEYAEDNPQEISLRKKVISKAGYGSNNTDIRIIEFILYLRGKQLK